MTQDGATPYDTELMAAVTGLQEARPGAMLCGVAPSPVGGMAVMYLLMSGFHLGPWLRLRSDRPSAH